MGRMRKGSSVGGGTQRGQAWPMEPAGSRLGRVGAVLLLLVVGMLGVTVATATAVGEDYRMVIDEVLDLGKPHEGAQLIRMSPDGRHAYVATCFFGRSSIGLVKVELDSMAVVGTLRFDSDAAHDAGRACSIAIDPEGRYGYVDGGLGDDGWTIDQIDLVTMTITDRIARPEEFAFAAQLGPGAVAPDGRTAYFTTPDGVFEVDLEEMAAGRHVETGVRATNFQIGFAQVLMAPDGEHLYHLGDQGVARVKLPEFEVTGFYATRNSDLEWGVTAALDPDGEYLFLAGHGGHLERVAVDTMRQTHQRRFTSPPAYNVAIEVDPDGEHVYVGSGGIHRFDADRLELLASLDLVVENDEVSALAFGGDAGHLYAASFAQNVDQESVLARIDVWPPPVPVEFSDVPEGSVHADNIGKLVEAGITRGYDDGTFQPQQPVNRQQMASFLTRGLELSPPASPISFGDVPRSSVHYDSIQALAGAGITLGCGGGSFCPNDVVTREQMASFLVRALEL